MEKATQKIVYISKIAILQSLPENELQTGTKLSEDIEVANDAYQRGITIEERNLSSKSDFIEYILYLTRNAKEKGEYPILHIETHGSDDQTGIILAYNEYISWEELKPHLVGLNIATKHNLFVILSMCHGAHLMRILQPTERAPCWGLLGPSESVDSGDLLKGFIPFYQEWLKTGSGDASLTALNKNIQNTSFSEFFTTSERFFIITYRKYLKNQCKIGRLKFRAKRLRKKSIKQGKQVRSQKFWQKELKSTQQKYFEHYRQKFFMIDLYPEIESRINVSYSDVLQ